MNTTTHGPGLLGRLKFGDWTITLTTIAQILIGITALVGILAWATLEPIFILTFLFLEPLLIVGLILFVIAAAFSGKTLLTVYFRAGDVVFRQGTSADFVYLVESGQLKGVEVDGENRYTSEFGPGDCFGTRAMLAEQPHRLTVTAETDAVVIRIEPKDIVALAASKPQFEKSLRSLLDTSITDLVSPTGSRPT